MGLHAAIIRLSPLIHEGEQRYKPYIVDDPRMVSLLNLTSSLCDPPFEKSWLRPCVMYGGLPGTDKRARAMQACSGY